MILSGCALRQMHRLRLSLSFLPVLGENGAGLRTIWWLGRMERARRRLADVISRSAHLHRSVDGGGNFVGYISNRPTHLVDIEKANQVGKGE